MSRAYTKRALKAIIVELLADQGGAHLCASLQGESGGLPLELEFDVTQAQRRRYQVFIWTIGHGGRTRSLHEYRIQTKLKAGRRLEFRGGTPLLLGYYH